jgi:hypothetical protein
VSVNPSAKNMDWFRCNRVLKEVIVQYNITHGPSPRDGDQSLWNKANAYKQTQELFDGPRSRPPVTELRELVIRMLCSCDDCKFKAPPTKKILYQKPNELRADIKDQMLPVLCHWRSS